MLEYSDPDNETCGGCLVACLFGSVVIPLVVVVLLFIVSVTERARFQSSVVGFGDYGRS